jgi:peptide/nickel transport system substrate-binding protein
MARSRMSVLFVGIAALLLAAACGDDDDGSGGAAGTGTAVSTGEDTTATSGVAAGTSGSTGETTGSSSGTSPPTAATSAPTVDGDLATTLDARFSTDTTTFDPIFLSTLSDLASGSILYETLIEPAVDGQGNVNVLADTWEVADDGLSIDFTLKEGVQFHDGYGEFTAEDVKFSLERAAGQLKGSEESGIASFYTALDHVEVSGKYSGTILMTEPSVTMVEQALPITPIYSKAAFDDLGADGIAQNPVGTGPYQLDEVVPGEYVKFVNFPDYSGSSPYVPEQRFDEMIFHIITEDSAAELAYEAGDLDLLVPIRAASASRFEELDNTEVTKYSTMVYRWIGMNILDPALSNRTLREAVIAAIDVPSIIVAMSDGEDERANALVAPNAPIGYWADAPVHEQDMDRARELVEQVPEAQRHLTFTIADDELSRTVAQVAQQNLEDAGLKVDIEILDAASFFVTGEGNRKRQLFYTEFGINYREPTQELLWFTCDQIDGWNYMYWCDERYSELFAQAQTELDRDKRNAMYIEMQERWEDAAHTVWISHPTTFIAARTDTVKVLADPVGSVYYAALTPQ